MKRRPEASTSIPRGLSTPGMAGGVPKSLRMNAVRATTPMMTNFLAPRSKTQSPLNRPSFAATPPATSAAIPYDATLSPAASLKSV
jgi:hypothetical protein